MGKDKVTYKEIRASKNVVLQEIADRCLEDCIDVLQKGRTTLQNDMYKECWLRGFQYAGERIQNILDRAR